ncbi:protein kinase domain protein [Ichthyophthirius multifiliis]|uniref:Casein kinase I n=1 Tax=Ichthyophthirius multifiliis TaxID=5932 RepID=G0QQT3_ICHMU|nr:protein kinase domain protein [Ichthyophthirius multifiliis]EGR32425.1 protein kinase domain protein [Ichthyophthirius multifiliis]|eukprot:XP_004036411.1 protein kinase domain protein [Ichthyophthirius multifiliis]
MLIKEIKLMYLLKEEEGFPQIIGYGKTSSFNYAIMTFLGKNLSQISAKCGNKLSLYSTIQVGLQLLDRIECFHKYGLIHRDIKPENIVIGNEEQYEKIFLLDFGLAKFYRDKQKVHIPYVNKKGMIGTARFASINAHNGIEQSRRDDLESFGYTLVYILRGKLAWQCTNLGKSRNEKYQRIKEIKENITLEKLCEGCPKEFQSFFQLIRNLKFTEEPQYDVYREIFRSCLINRKNQDNNRLDWENLPEYRRNKNTSIILQNNNLQNSLINFPVLNNNNNNINAIKLNSMPVISENKNLYQNKESSNILVVPQYLSKEQISISSFGGSSKQNNYFTFSQEDSIQDEGQVVSSNLINKDVNFLNPQIIRNDIRKNSIFFIIDGDIKRNSNNNEHQEDFNKFQQQNNDKQNTEIQEYQEVNSKFSIYQQDQSIFQALNENVLDNNSSSPIKVNVFITQLNKNNLNI